MQRFKNWRNESKHKKEMRRETAMREADELASISATMSLPSAPPEPWEYRALTPTAPPAVEEEAMFTRYLTPTAPSVDVYEAWERSLLSGASSEKREAARLEREAADRRVSAERRETARLEREAADRRASAERKRETARLFLLERDAADRRASAERREAAERRASAERKIEAARLQREKEDRRRKRKMARLEREGRDAADPSLPSADRGLNSIDFGATPGSREDTELRALGEKIEKMVEFFYSQRQTDFDFDKMIILDISTDDGGVKLLVKGGYIDTKGGWMWNKRREESSWITLEQAWEVLTTYNQRMTLITFINIYIHSNFARPAQTYLFLKSAARLRNFLRFVSSDLSSPLMVLN